MADDLPELIVRDAAAWRTWLAEHHADPVGVWLVLAKKGTEKPTSLTYDQALEEALCHGWIDGQAGRRDEATYRQRFTPRRRRSAWSKRNTGIAERLIAEDRMRPAGHAEVERAKADGRWEAAYAPMRDTTAAAIPHDLRAAIEANTRAQRTFRGLSKQNLFALAFRTNAMKTPAGRARKILELVAMLARGETIVPNSAPRSRPRSRRPPRRPRRP